MKGWLVALALLLGGAPAWAETAIRSQAVQFKKGESGAMLKGSIKGEQIVDYKLRAGAGQKMTVTFKPSNPSAYFNVLPPGTEAAIHIGSVAGNEFSGELPAAGEYRIRVFLVRAAGRRGESANYTLSVSVTGAAAKAGAKASPPTAATGGNAPSAAERAGMGKFDATGRIPCAQAKGQPMGQCEFGVAREGGGTATVIVTRLDGRKRAIFFEKGKATGADTSQADGHGAFSAKKESDLNFIRVGDERYEIPDAVPSGG